MIRSIKAVARALDEAGVAYLVVGGVAVALHGYLRATQDLDLVIGLERGNALRAVEALSALGYRPIVPVRLEDFADPAVRRHWVEEKGMTVFSLVSDRYRRLAIDLFAEVPFDFQQEFERREGSEIEPGLVLPLVSVETLIRMKEAVGRPRDRDDAEHLRVILEERSREGDRP
jgi:hypothetical protein